MAEEKQVFAYRAVCQHGKTRALVVDRPDIMKDSAKDIAIWLRDGLHLERVTVEEARKSDMDCQPCDEFWRAKRKRKKSESPEQTKIGGVCLIVSEYRWKAHCFVRRVQMFCLTVGREWHGVRIYPRLAWKLAGIVWGDE